MIKLLSIILALSTTAICLGNQVEKPTQEKLVPANTSVAIIPVLNLSGEKWVELKDKQNAKGNEYLKTEFEKRGFTLVPSDSVTKAIKDLKFDFTDEEQQKRSNLFSLGKTLHANLVIMVIITDTGQHLIQQLLSSKREGFARVKVWLLNTDKEDAIISAKTVEGRSGGGFFAGFDKGSDRQVIAVANGLRDCLKDFLKPYADLTKKH